VSYVWKIVKVGDDEYDLYRDGVLLFHRAAKQIYLDARFHYHFNELMRQLSATGVAVLEVARGSLKQFNPFPI
jgi:hypothetical protein